MTKVNAMLPKDRDVHSANRALPPAMRHAFVNFCNMVAFILIGMLIVSFIDVCKISALGCVLTKCMP